MAKLIELLEDPDFTDGVDQGHADLLFVAEKLASNGHHRRLTGYVIGLMAAAAKLCFLHNESDMAKTREMFFSQAEAAWALLEGQVEKAANNNKTNKPTGPKKPDLN